MKTNRQVLSMFETRSNASATGLHIAYEAHDRVLYSYLARVARWVGTVAFINTTYYSPTTRQHLPSSYGIRKTQPTALVVEAPLAGRLDSIEKLLDISILPNAPEWGKESYLIKLYDGARLLSSHDEGRSSGEKLHPMRFSVIVPGEPNTVEEALEALKPQEVREAIAAGIAVKRQGEYWFVETGLSLVDMGSGGFGRHTVQRRSAIASVHASGKVSHPEHRTLYLGHSWWKVLHNGGIPVPSRISGGD